MHLHRGGDAIRSLDDWRKIAPPKGKDRHWKDGRSAKELARAWAGGPIGPAPPQDLVKLLNRYEAFRGVTILEAIPEDRLPFDDRAGEPRNSDLTLICKAAHGPVVISVEAKADEPLGGTVRAAKAAAEARIANGERSNGAARAEWLTNVLLPAGTIDADRLPYQLFTATAGLLALAQRQSAVAALMLIHEFVNGASEEGLLATDPKKVDRNAKQVNAFLSAVSAGAFQTLECGTIVGPVAIRGANCPWPPVPLYYGKLRTDLSRVAV